MPLSWAVRREGLAVGTGAYMDAEEECKGVSAGAEKTEPRDVCVSPNVAQAPNNGATRPFAPVLVLDADF